MKLKLNRYELKCLIALCKQKQEYYTKISLLKLLKLQMMSSAEEYVIVFFI